MAKTFRKYKGGDPRVARSLNKRQVLQVSAGAGATLHAVGNKLVFGGQRKRRGAIPMLWQATGDEAAGSITVKRVESDGTTLVGDTRTVKVVT